jgi:hypothetical protein
MVNGMAWGSQLLCQVGSDVLNGLDALAVQIVQNLPDCVSFSLIICHAMLDFQGVSCFSV